MMKNLSVIWLGLIGWGMLLAGGCQGSSPSVKLKPGDAEAYREVSSQPVHRLENYSFSPSSSLLSRVGKPPETVRKYWSEMDERDYQVYLPSEKELELIASELENLPPLHRRILRERCVGIYFLDDFWGSGLADWIIGEEGKIYSYLVFHSGTLKTNISQWLTYKETTCFITQGNTSFRVEIDCGNDLSGLAYILPHESTHIVDYVTNMTPYVEYNTMLHTLVNGKKIRPIIPFVAGIWKEYNRPVRDFPRRKDITFYGFGKGPHIALEDAARLYRDLSSSPFVSLYGAQNWAEDLAEYVTFYHLTQVRKIPYRITVWKDDVPADSFEPLSFPGVKKRYERMKIFYQE